MRWAVKVAQSAQIIGKETEMPARLLSVVGLTLIALGSAAQVSAEILCDAVNSVVRDTKRRNCWPEPFSGPDRATVRAPFCIMVANGWRRQNMLGEFHFEPTTGQLTEAGRLKVRWILTACPEQHRLIYVHTAEKDEETSARIAAVQHLAAQIAPNDLPPVMPTSISDDGWPADQVDLIGRKYQSSIPAPRLPPPPGAAALAAAALAAAAAEISQSALLPHFFNSRVADSATSANPPQPESSVAGRLGSRSISRTKLDLGLRTSVFAPR